MNSLINFNIQNENEALQVINQLNEQSIYDILTTNINRKYSPYQQLPMPSLQTARYGKTEISTSYIFIRNIIFSVRGRDIFQDFTVLHLRAKSTPHCLVYFFATE